MINVDETPDDPELAWAAQKRTINMAVVARQLGLTRAAVSAWRKVPAEAVATVSRMTGIPREQLRPDLYNQRGEPWSSL